MHHGSLVADFLRASNPSVSAIVSVNRCKRRLRDSDNGTHWEVIGFSLRDKESFIGLLEASHVP